MSGYVDNTTFSGWDKGLDFNIQKVKLTTLVRDTRDQVDKAKYAIALIQLENGSRIGEAIAAAYEWALDGKKELRVRAEKRKDKYMRLMVIPEVIRNYPNLREVILGLCENYRINPVMRMFCKRRLGYNSHAQRYAFISDVSNNDQKPAEFIAKMTGQKDAKVVVRYISQKAAESALRVRVQ